MIMTGDLLFYSGSRRVVKPFRVCIEIVVKYSKRFG